MKKKTYEELENEVARLKRSCASYKSENTKLRAKWCDLMEQYSELALKYDLADKFNDELINELNRRRTWWGKLKDLFA